MALHLAPHTLKDAERCNITGVQLDSRGRSFATSTLEGWIIYRTYPLEILTRHDIANSSLGIVLPLEQTNISFLVGGPPSPLYPPNKVIVWDDKLGKAIAELEFREEVRGLVARKDRLVVALRRRIIIYVLGRGSIGIWREGSYETCDNPTGLVSLASDPGSTLLAFPGRQAGQVQLVRLPPYTPEIPPFPPPPSHDPLSPPYPSVSIIVAHTSALSALAMTPSGHLLATTSKQGTLVRVWNPTTNHLVKELRRGTDTAEIFGLSLRPDGGAIAVSSDKGTVHVWDLENSKEERRRSRSGSDSGSSTPRQKQLSMLKPYLPKYFSSEWSHSQFRLPAPTPSGSRLPTMPSMTTPTPSSTTPTVEDDRCLCVWIEVELSDDETDDEQSSSKTSYISPATFTSASRPSSRGRGTSTSSSHPSSISSSPARGNRNPTSKDLSHQPSLQRQPFSSSRPSTTTPTNTKSHSHRSGHIEIVEEKQRRKRREAQLVAITQSGGWFRVSLDGSHDEGGTSSSKGKEKEASGSSTPTPRKREEGMTGLGRDSTSNCRLVEYRRFGTDGW